MASIESDIISGHFDPTPYTKVGKVKKQNIKLTAVELFDRYAAVRIADHELSNSSKSRFKGISSRLKQFLYKTLATGLMPISAVI
jgi:predicted KAP-like P-loop ATPase